MKNLDYTCYTVIVLYNFYMHKPPSKIRKMCTLNDFKWVYLN